MTHPPAPPDIDAIIHAALRAVLLGDLEKAAALLDQAEHLIQGEQEAGKAA